MHKRGLQLDSRLSAALQMAMPFDISADIGADHGQLSAFILLNQLAKQALIADVSDKALEKARKCIHELKLDDQAIFAVADGLDALDALSPLHADVIFILGMGGETMSGILRRGASRLHGATLILGAHTEIPLVRQTIQEIGYQITDEDVAKVDRFSYILMKCQPAANAQVRYTQRELLLGPILLQTYPALWIPMLARKKASLEQGIRAMSASTAQLHTMRLKQFKLELGYVDDALKQAVAHNPDKESEFS